MNNAQFGKISSGQRRERILKSPNYRHGKFQNLSHTPGLAEGTSYTKLMWDFFFSPKKRAKPASPVPSVKVDLNALAPEDAVLVWFGHSSYFMQLNGKKILVDPVLSGSASPVSFTTKAFPGTDPYSVNDIPAIDYLFITHDHWDHLDYKTIKALKPKIGKIICPLGAGAHFEHWGFSLGMIEEKDWNEDIDLGYGFSAHTVPARHFSGRGFKRDQSLWTSYVLNTPDYRIFIGGDSGYDSHFAEIGSKFGPFDLAILENGQYNEMWKYIHMMPNQVLQAAKELGAKKLIPVHSSKFALALHDWDTPLRTITELNKDINLPLITPKIGEIVHLKEEGKTYHPWWTDIN